MSRQPVLIVRAWGSDLYDEASWDEAGTWQSEGGLYGAEPEGLHLQPAPAGSKPLGPEPPTTFPRTEPKTRSPKSYMSNIIGAPTRTKTLKSSRHAAADVAF